MTGFADRREKYIRRLVNAIHESRSLLHVHTYYTYFKCCSRLPFFFFFFFNWLNKTNKIFLRLEAARYYIVSRGVCVDRLTIYTTTGVFFFFHVISRFIQEYLNFKYYFEQVYFTDIYIYIYSLFLFLITWKLYRYRMCPCRSESLWFMTFCVSLIDGVYIYLKQWSFMINELVLAML